MRENTWPGLSIRFAVPARERFEGAAAGAVNAGEAEDVHRHAAAAPEIEPARFGGDPPAAALAARRQLGSLVDPAAAAVAVDTGRRKIAQPTETFDTGDVLTMQREHGVAGGIGRNRHEEMRDPVQRFPRSGWSRSKTSTRNPAARSAAALSAVRQVPPTIQPSAASRRASTRAV